MPASDAHSGQFPEWPAFIRRITLGVWAPVAMQRGIIPIGHHAASHEACASGDWIGVQQQLSAAGYSSEAALHAAAQLCAFYTVGEKALWVTEIDGARWWATARGPVHPWPGDETGAPARYLETHDGWRQTVLPQDPS